MLLSIVRTVLIYIFLFIALKAMGKRELAQLHPFELVVLFMISEMATLAMQGDGIPLTNSIVPIVTLAILQITGSLIALKTPAFRSFISGSPSVIIRNGVVQQSELKKLRMTIDDLEESLRFQGFFSVSEVEYAIMETNGQVSAMPKTVHRPVKPSDLALSPAPESPPFMIIQDGVLDMPRLKESGFNREWLEKQLRSNHIEKISDIFIGLIDCNGSFFFQLKNLNKKT